MMLRNSTSTMSGAATSDFVGTWFYIGNMTKATIMAVGDGASVGGSIKLQVSNESSPGGPQMPFTPTVYVELASPSATISGTTAVVTSPVDLAYQWARLVYRWAPGSSGVATALFAAHD